MHTPASHRESPQHSALRHAFDTKTITTDQLNEQEKLDFIVAQLQNKHKAKVDQYNNHRKNTFGSILLTVNYRDTGLIERLGGGSLGAVDIQDDVIAFIMGYSESVQGHGVRYLAEYGICRNGKIVSTGPMTYRGAYASETDHREKAYNKIKILDVTADKVTFGVSSGQQLLIQELDTKSNGFSTKESYNLAEEQRKSEEKKLAETLTTGRKENLKNIRELISKKTGQREDVEDPFVTDTFAIFPVVKYDQDYDASDRSYTLYIIGDNHQEPTVLHEARCNYSPRTSGRFFRNKAKFSFAQKTEGELQVHITYKHGDYSSTPGYVHTISQEDISITLPTSK